MGRKIVVELTNMSDVEHAHLANAVWALMKASSQSEYRVGVDGSSRAAVYPLMHEMWNDAPRWDEKSGEWTG